MSLSTLSSSAMCLCSSSDGHGSKPITREETGQQAADTCQSSSEVSVALNDGSEEGGLEDKEKKKKKVDENLANTFSNIGFILNTNYAKRNNIDPAIVAQKRKICDNYIKRYAPMAVKEMKKYGIPASITLAQGLLESNAGASKLATKNNNHFGIKCFAKSCKKGHCSNYTDDSHKDFFRAYKGVEESYHAHSLFLQRNRYQHLAKLGTKNYKDWAHGLRKAGYATDKAYAPKLIKLIEVLKLNRFDQ